MSRSQCLVGSCYYRLHQHKNLSHEVFMKNNFNVKKNFVIYASSSSSSSRLKKCALKAKSDVASTEFKKEPDDEEDKNKKQKRVRILIAGGGIGGLVLALAAKKRGFEVTVFEKDLSAVKGEGRHRGPIQLMSSALGVLESIDKGVADQVMDAGCFIGDRMNGLADGLSGNWIAKFDLLTPAMNHGLPTTLVISRMTLQEILLNAVGDHIVLNKSKVVDFSQDNHKVVVTLDDGQQFEGDILVGADGIWSEVRKKLFGVQEACYSGYTCYSGLAEYTPSYKSSVGYRVFLGPGQYFVACDVGNDKMQWYAFHNEPSRSYDTLAELTLKKVKLMELFGCWCNDVTTLIHRTREENIIQRDIYDRDIIYSWGIGRVTLLGDAAHPVQPNLGLGGCLAIEDCHRLILELESIMKYEPDIITLNEIVSVLKRYEQKRMLRTRIVHGVTRMASKSLGSYQTSTKFKMIWHICFQVVGFPLRLVLPHFLPWLVTGHWI